MATEAAMNRAPSDWWIVLLQGIAVIILGIFLISAPGMTTVALVGVLGLFLLALGLLAIVRIFLGGAQARSHWVWSLLVGVLGILAGILVLQNLLFSTVIIPTTLVVLVGVIAIVMGIVDVVRGFRGGGWSAFLVGALDLIIGFLLLGSVLQIASALPIWLGTIGLFVGFFLIILAFGKRAQAQAAPQG